MNWSEPSRLDEVSFVKVSKKQVGFFGFFFLLGSCVFFGGGLRLRKFELLASTWRVDRCEKNLFVGWVADVPWTISSSGLSECRRWSSFIGFGISWNSWNQKVDILLGL